MRISTTSYDLLQRNTFRDHAFVAAVVVFLGAFAGITGYAGYWFGTVFFGAPAVLMTALWVRRPRRPVLRVNRIGVTLSPGGRQKRGLGEVIRWRDIDAVVCWKGGKTRDGYWVGVSSPAHRRRHGLGQSAMMRGLDEAIGMPVMGTVVAWAGPGEEIARLRAAVAQAAPDVPFVDPIALRDARNPPSAPNRRWWRFGH
ncbi:hypothetical protein [Yinghuangia soli]|uniref:Uncharacterized protein n=1 Tax=Yinghuangia soli TaxID=2908204 RepID=A0AA41PW10_9ACTN|nr:hypothetical protein [Yinghuangia soli]MCF2526885.1 hypothetical protein [Yinghuangia soli]